MTFATLSKLERNNVDDLLLLHYVIRFSFSLVNFYLVYSKLLFHKPFSKNLFTSPSNFSLLSIITPRYFTLFDSALISLSTFRTVFFNLFLVLNTIYSVFCLFTTNWDFAKKSIIFEMLCSSFVFDNISSVSDVKRKVSSAYWTTVQSFSTIFANSLT